MVVIPRKHAGNMGDLNQTLPKIAKRKVLWAPASVSEELADVRSEPNRTRFLPKLAGSGRPNFLESDVSEVPLISIVFNFSRKVNPMRLAVCVATLAVMAVSTVAAAGENAVHVLPASTSITSAPIVKVSQSRSIFQPVRRTQKSFFGRIMDLERRKNAWLRRTFLN